MEALDWPQTSQTSNFNVSTTTATIAAFSPLEWKMETFSSTSQLGKIPLRKEGKRKAKVKETKDEDEEEETERARSEWDFILSTVVSSSHTVAAVSDTIGVIEIDPSDTLIATGGIARKIRIYKEKTLLPCEGDNVALLDHGTARDFCMCTPAKLSSIKWRPGLGGRVIGSGDYDGVVTEYDLEQRVPVFERDEHGGRRVWSLDYSHRDPVIGASGSDDGTIQIWDPRCNTGGECLAAVRPGLTGTSAVCCVEFDPFGGPLIAAGCADRRAYGYDIRKMSDPVLVLEGHQRTVSYARFLDAGTLVTASTDGRLKLWNLNDTRAIRTYKGHVNSRNFVGLSVWRDGGLLGCGSENNQIFVYDKRWGEPIWVRDFGTGSGSRFVSSVCWRQTGEEECTLLAGGSDGALQVFRGKRKPSVSK